MANNSAFSSKKKKITRRASKQVGDGNHKKIECGRERNGRQGNRRSNNNGGGRQRDREGLNSNQKMEINKQRRDSV